MTRKRKVNFCAAIAVALLLVGICTGWWLRGPAKGSKELLELVNSMGPKPAIEKDWQALTLVKSKENISGFQMQVVTIKNVRPLLEADELTSAQHLNVLNRRAKDEFKTTIWSRKANKALEFDWGEGKVRWAEKPAVDITFYIGPEATPVRNKYDHDFYMSATPNQKKEIELIIETPNGKKKKTWDRPSLLVGAYFFKDYKYGCILERNIKAKTIDGFAVVDFEDLDVTGCVATPPQVGRYAPLLLIDPNTDLLLCFDLDIAWIVYVDLRPGIDQTKKPWPPPWPHPALGPWHGNDDVMAGRFTQLPEGAPVPPKPADYP